EMVTISTWRPVLCGALLAGGIVAATTPAASAAVCTSGVPGDVNGDGYAEVAVSETGRPDDQGAVHVFYGRPTGLAANGSGTALDDQYLDQDQPGVPGTGSNGDDFGTAVAFGDYNADGCSDLAVGAATDSVAGTVYIFYGSKSGLRTTGSQRITDVQLLGDPGQFTDQGFATALTAADLNDDGDDDLAIGVPGHREAGEIRGAVVVLLGGSGGLTAADKTVVDRGNADIGDQAIYFGSQLAAGDFDGDGIQELAVTFGHVTSGDDEEGAGVGGNPAGWVQVLEGTTSGLTPTMDEPLDGPALGIDDRVREEDGDPDQLAFGDVTAAGDVNADGRDDLAVGMPTLGNSGVVALVKGSAQGLAAPGLERWTQATTGVAGTPADFDSFGAALAMGRLDAGPTDDLAIGTPFDVIDGRRGAGSVSILLGSASGLTTAGQGGARYHQNTSGIAGVAEAEDMFGEAVAIANVQSRTQGCLVIGVYREKVGTRDGTGQIHQLSKDASGPKTGGSVALNLDSPGVRGASREDAHFGRALD
ncbi:MAG: hypothetical protein JWP56_2187, partial [Aeromicrobium sp.]|nr:hypothetical protein [Aeromicrobium sp.]